MHGKPWFDAARSHLPSLTLAAALALILPAASRAAPVAGTLVGSPTYSLSGGVTEDRGHLGHPGPLIITCDNGCQGYNGNGSVAVLGMGIGMNPSTSALPLSGFDRSLATGAVNANELKSQARVTGGLGFWDASRVMPSLHAHSQASITRYFEFSSSTASTVPLDFTAFLDGTLRAGYVRGELMAAGRATVDFGLRVVDLSNNTLATVFQVHAEQSPTGLAPVWATGAADPALWTAALQSRDESANPIVARSTAVAYVDDMMAAYLAPVGVPIGLQWFLDTDASVLGLGLPDTLVDADFGHTAVVGFAINAAAASTASVVEWLSAATPTAGNLPEPGSAALVLLALLPLAHRRRGG